jgi:hypothetical protein
MKLSRQALARCILNDAGKAIVRPARASRDNEVAPTGPEVIYEVVSSGPGEMHSE